MKYLLTCLALISIQLITAQTPTLNCPGNIFVNNDPGGCDAFVTYTLPTCATNCAGTSIYQSDPTGFSSGSNFPGGVTYLEYTITNGSDSSICFFKVQVDDVENPQVSCTSNLNGYVDASCNFLVPDYLNATYVTATDNCYIDTMIQNPAAGTIISGIGGIQNIQITAIDSVGNSGTCNFDVSILDSLSPSIICPGNQVEPISGSCAATLQNYIALTSVSDNCDSNPAVTQSPVSGTPFITSQVVTIYAQDISGNIDSCSFTVTAADNAAPLVSCPADTLIYVDGSCEYFIADFTSLVTAIDNCDPNVMIIQTPTAGTKISGSGTTNFISMQATDVSGNSSVCSFNITLADSTAPVISNCQDSTVYLNGFCEYTLSDYSPMLAATDNCSSLSILQTPTSGTLISSATATPVTINVNDLSGNSVGCSFNIITLDTISPVISSCWNDTTISTGPNNCSYTLTDVTANINASDNCTGSLTITQDIPPLTNLALGTNTIVFTVTDDYGNDATCSTLVTIVDLVLPSISCPLNPDVYANSGCDYIVPSFDTIISISDNCGPISGYSQTPLPGTVVSGIGTQQTISVFVNDASGNSNSCSFTVTIIDSISPAVSCPGLQSIDIDANCQYQIPNFETLTTYSDLCDANPIYNQSPLPGVTITTSADVTVTITDASGNSSQCIILTIANDTIAPTLTCMSDTASCAAVYTYSDPIGNDNCGVVTVTQSNTHTLTSGGTFPEGVTPITFVAEDEIGNQTTCSFNITVLPAPVIDMPNFSTEIEENDSVSINPIYTNTSVVIWSPNYNINDISSLNPTVSPSEDFTYYITATSSDGCVTTDSVTIPVNEIDELIINNFLSPNGDGKNDTWNMNKVSLISGCFVSIFDRWGKLAWQSTSYSNNWDGKNEVGIEMPDGTYYYSVRCSGQKDIKGTILLMR
ncbi:MAG: gliding motility-associated-like protein [Flavobacteriales bacterium]|jgi:gliding motility-associated-like protein